MTHPKFPGPDSSLCVLYHDFERLDDTGLLWYDRGPNKLHATPVGYAAPNYGLARTARGKGYATFNGANQWAELAGGVQGSFYAVAPSSGYTAVLVARHTTPVALARIFNCRNGAATRGIGIRYLAVDQMLAAAWDAGGVATQINETAAIQYVSRTRVSIYAMAKTAGTASIWHDTVQVAATFAGNTNPIAYDATVVPTIGSLTGGGNPFTGTMYALILYRDYIPSHAEAVSMSRFWRDRI